MSGKYVNISENDYSREDGSIFLEGRTHGCSCCSTEEEVTAESLTEHIKLPKICEKPRRSGREDVNRRRNC